MLSRISGVCAGILRNTATFYTKIVEESYFFFLSRLKNIMKLAKTQGFRPV